VNVVLAVLVVGLGSLAFRLVPMLSGRQVPAPLARGAGWAGMAVIAGMTVRATVLHEDASVPMAPLAALFAVTACFVVAFRGHSVLLAVGAGCASYVVIGALMAGLG
jgi:branched-subunit amino acid transport protein AzlD